MSRTLRGIHHVTAIARDPQENLDFYTEVLGMRLVKRTVNFDDPGTHHLYFGDELGRPGTILTFFPWPGARRGRRGVGQATVTSFSVPQRALDYWAGRLRDRRVALEETKSRFGQQVLTFFDPHGLALELVGHAEAEAGESWSGSVIPPSFAIRGFHGVTLRQRDAEVTGDFLRRSLGFELEAESGLRRRYRAPGSGPGRWVDVVADPGGSSGQIAAGTVHHVAWCVGGDEEQLAWRKDLSESGIHVSPVMDRQYFHSIYFREPGGVLFEIATESPGFAADEEVGELGAGLKLPPWLEPHRSEIEQVLPGLRVRGVVPGVQEG